MQKLPNPLEQRQFFSALDSLRGIAALIVAIYHIRWMNPLYNWGLIRNGYLMVDFFFVLSGFIIFHSYRHKISNGGELGRFMWLRAGRLYPLHFVILIVFLGIEGLKWIKEFVTGSIGETAAFSINNGFAFLTNFFLVQALGIHQSSTFNSASWSISTEFYTYLIFALVLLFARTSLTQITTSIFLVSMSTWIIFSVHKTDLDFTYDYGIFRCVASFFIGVVTYQIHELFSRRAGTDEKGKLTAAIYSIAILAGIIIFLFVKERGYTDFFLPPFFALLILSITSVPNTLLSGVLNLKPLTWLGKVSYSIYMVQAVVLTVFHNILEFVFKLPLLASHSISNSLQTENLVNSTAYKSAGIDTNSALHFVLFCLAIATILILSHFTYTWIEAPFRNRSKKLAERWFSKEEEQVVPEEKLYIHL
jgi:peptidoglycan/LPS O-acetylase OafA/YrhL